MKILHLEDSDDDAELIRTALRDQVSPNEVTRVETGGTFLEALHQDDWDIILADYSLPRTICLPVKPGVPPYKHVLPSARDCASATLPG